MHLSGLHKSSLWALLAVAAIVVGGGVAASKPKAKEAVDGAKLREQLNTIDQCFLDSVYSFIHPNSHPPSNTKEFVDGCQRQSIGFRCVKDRTKTGLPSIIRRGLMSFLQSRQKFHKKYCSAPQSEQTQKFINDMRCIMQKRQTVYRENAARFANSAYELLRRNYNDSTTELKYICCAMYQHKKDMIESIGDECKHTKQSVEELASNTITDDVALICDDEDKTMTKICPKLEPLKVSNQLDPKAPSPASAYMYLVATLGEPEAEGSTAIGSLARTTSTGS